VEILDPSTWIKAVFVLKICLALGQYSMMLATRPCCARGKKIAHM